MKWHTRCVSVPALLSRKGSDLSPCAPSIPGTSIRMKPLCALNGPVTTPDQLLRSGTKAAAAKTMHRHLAVPDASTIHRFHPPPPTAASSRAPAATPQDHQTLAPHRHPVTCAPIPTRGIAAPPPLREQDIAPAARPASQPDTYSRASTSASDQARRCQGHRRHLVVSDDSTTLRLHSPPLPAAHRPSHLLTPHRITKPWRLTAIRSPAPRFPHRQPRPVALHRHRRTDASHEDSRMGDTGVTCYGRLHSQPAGPTGSLVSISLNNSSGPHPPPSRVPQRHLCQDARADDK